MRLLILFGWLCYTLATSTISSAQNLIPNPGFEESTNGRVNLWVQPQGAFYHYTSRMVVVGGVPTLESTNALHVGNTSGGAEYMYVRLNTQLQKGVSYCAKMKVKMPSLNKSEAKIIESLGWCWFEEEPNVSARTFLYQTPSIIFPLTNTNVYDDFVELTQTYIAKGGERILVIGKFFLKNDITSLEATKNTLAEYKTTYNVTKQQIADSFIRLYPPLPDYTKIRSERKARKLFKKIDEKILTLSNQKKLIDDSLMLVYQPTIDSLHKQISESTQTVDILTYFDDLCLSPIMNNKKCTCHVKSITSEFIVGETYRLNAVNFETNNFNLSVEAMRELDGLFLVLQKNPNFKVSILGHTDNTASDGHNFKLSENRSKACADYLIEKGIGANRVTWKGLGASKPLVDNNNEEGRATNRRVEFVLEN